jgi:hypothetical protein
LTGTGNDAIGIPDPQLPGYGPGKVIKRHLDLDRNAGVTVESQALPLPAHIR